MPDSTDLASSIDPSTTSQFVPFPRQFYPPSLRSYRKLATFTNTLPVINEDKSASTEPMSWDHLSPGRLSPPLSTAEFSTASSWFPGSFKKHRLGRRDVMFNIQAMETLAKASRGYEDALRQASEASMSFADALEQFSRVKDLQVEDEEEEQEDEEDDLVEGLRTLSAYQFYIGNQQCVLAELIRKQCTMPMVSQYEAYRDTLIVCPSHSTLTIRHFKELTPPN
jgi:hypothetical protein